MQTSLPTLVVSIHDVSPLTKDSVEAILRDLVAVGVDRTSLLVIPNHHHMAPLSEDPGFRAWLREKAGDGHEIVLHGYFHQRPRRAGAWASSLVTECYTAGEGEFYDLSENEAGRLLQNGMADLKLAGFCPPGFIAPAWLLGEDAEKAVKKAGFAYTTRLKNIKNLTTGRETPSQSLVWSVRAAWRRQVSLWWNAALARRLTSAPVVRVGLHPPDWEYPAIRMQALKLIPCALARRRVMTYRGWITQQGQ